MSAHSSVQETIIRTCLVDLSSVFNVFSKRPRQPVRADTPLTEQFRIRAIKLFFSQFPRYEGDLFQGPINSPFWEETHSNLLYLLGVHHLSGRNTSLAYEDIWQFLHECSDEHFLDFVELALKSEKIWSQGRIRGEDYNGLIRNVNTFFEQDALPYFLTDPELLEDPAGNRVIYPHIICRDNEVLHETAIEPTLMFLSKPAFSSANEEFHKALEDYRNGDYSDCVTMCGTSLESVMKIVCDLKGWQHNQTDTAATLLRTILPQTNLDSFFEQPIMLIATIRNRLSSAHGAGTQHRVVPRHVSLYALNATASAILLLVEATNP